MKRESSTRRLAASLAIVAAGALVAGLPARAAYAPSAEGTGLAVVTDHVESTRAALDALHGGGNAVDGAIAAALVDGVVGPHASGLGGGGFALVYVAKERHTYAIDFHEAAPSEVSVEGIVARASHEEATKRGVSIGIPGEPAGLEMLAKRFGRRTMAEDAYPAADLASRGFAASRTLLRQVDWTRTELLASRELASTYFMPGGMAIPFGRLVKNEDLARTIRRFASEGARPFYQGDIAARIASSANAAGGTITAADLAAYKAIDREPLVREIDGRTIATFPAPSAGGLMLLEVLTMFGASRTSPLASMGFGSSLYLHTVAEAMRGAVADRARVAGDPDLDPGVATNYDYALDPKQLAARRARIEPNRTHPISEFHTREAGTAHVIVADRDGNVVSLTSSVNEGFGARVVAEGTGIVLNDQLDDFSTLADVKAFHVIGLGPNRPRGKARPVSSMAPSIVFENGVPILAIGGTGGERIATGVTQAAIARLVFGFDPGTCVGAPRVHVRGAGSEIVLPMDVADDVRQGLRARGESIADDDDPFASISMVAWQRGPLGNARVLAAADPRKEGFAAAE